MGLLSTRKSGKTTDKQPAPKLAVTIPDGLKVLDISDVKSQKQMSKLFYLLRGRLPKEERHIVDEAKKQATKTPG